MNPKKIKTALLVFLGIILFFIPIVSAANWQNGTNWNQGTNWQGLYATATATPTPSPTPSPTPQPSFNHFTISVPATATAGTSFGNVIVTAYSSTDNSQVMTWYRGQVYFASSDTKATLPYNSTTRYTFTSDDNGVHTFSGFTLGTIGSQVITVYDYATSTFKMSSNIAVSAGAIDHITISPATPTEITAPATITYASYAWDIYDNSLGTITSVTTWSTNASAGGSWSQGTYTSENAGTWIISASYSGKNAYTTLIVDAATGYTLNIAITSPSNSSYSSNSVPFIYTTETTGTGLTTWYSLNGSTNTTITANTTLTGLDNDNYALTLYANITEGNTAIYTVNFQVNVPNTNPNFPVEGREDFYFLSTTHTVNDNLAYVLSTSKGNDETSVTRQFDGTSNVDFGFKAWVVHSNSASDTPILGNDVVVMFSRSANGTGYQTSTATATSVPFAIGLNAIKVILYERYNYGEWVATASFITARLLEKGIETATWNFTMYTNVTYTDTETWVTAAWGGGDSDDSGLYSVVFDEPLAQEKGLAIGMAGDFVGMIVYPFIYIIGEFFYGLVLLFVGGNLYLRHRSLNVILIMLLLWGGTSGVGLLIPVMAYRIVYIVTLLAIAAILYKTWR